MSRGPRVRAVSRSCRLSRALVVRVVYRFAASCPRMISAPFDGVRGVADAHSDARRCRNDVPEVGDRGDRRGEHPFHCGTTLARQVCDRVLSPDHCALRARGAAPQRER